MIEQLNDALKNSQPQTSEGAFRPFFLKFILNFKKNGLEAPSEVGGCEKTRSKLQKKSVALSSKLRPYAFLSSKKYPIWAIFNDFKSFF